MARMKHILALTAAALLLSGCDTGSQTTKAVKLDAVEVEPGTVSDAMILLDDSDVDGTAIDNSGGKLTAEGAAIAKAEAEKAAAAAPPEEETGEQSETPEVPKAD
jgi:hypothetical protein